MFVKNVVIFDAIFTLKNRLRGRDSDPDKRLQRPLSYR